jgi:phosphatidate cytidylyltransferase
MFTYERGRDQAALDFAVTVGGLVYLGWIGAYLIDLRFLPNSHDGQWWLMIVLPSVWAADTAAYFVGIRWGRHHMSVRLSPKKSWEGYLGGVVFGTFIAGLFSWLWAHYFGLQVSILQGAILGLVLSAVTPLGDLGESLFKRQAGLKDSSNIFPGHGGAFDRIDSWIWAGIIGVYMIRWFFLQLP